MDCVRTSADSFENFPRYASTRPTQRWSSTFELQKKVFMSYFLVQLRGQREMMAVELGHEQRKPWLKGATKKPISLTEVHFNKTF